MYTIQEVPVTKRDESQTYKTERQKKYKSTWAPLARTKFKKHKTRPDKEPDRPSIHPRTTPNE